MFKKVISYTDYNGTKRNEEFCFNFTKAEIWDLDLRTPGGIKALYQRIIDTQDGQGLADQFKFLIQKSYGVKSLDGRRFMKGDEVLKNFTETEAYSNFYIELATNSDSAAAFINGIMPKDLVEEALKEGAAQAANSNLLQIPQFNNQPTVPVSQPETVAPQVVQPQQPVYSSEPVLPMEVQPPVPQA